MPENEQKPDDLKPQGEPMPGTLTSPNMYHMDLLVELMPEDRKKVFDRFVERHPAIGSVPRTPPNDEQVE